MLPESRGSYLPRQQEHSRDARSNTGTRCSGGAQEVTQAGAQFAARELATQLGAVFIEQALADRGQEMAVAEQAGKGAMAAVADRLGHGAAEVAHGCQQRRETVLLQAVGRFASVFLHLGLRGRSDRRHRITRCPPNRLFIVCEQRRYRGLPRRPFYVVSQQA